MRIAFFLEKYPALSETAVLHQIAETVDANHDVTIYSIGRGDYLNAHPTASRIRPLIRHVSTPLPRGVTDHIRLLTKFGRQLPTQFYHSLAHTKVFTVPAARQILAHYQVCPRPEHYDIIHGQFGTSARRAAMLIRSGLLHGPLIATFRGFDANVVPRTVSASYYALLFSTAARFTVSSSFMKQRLITLGAPADKIEIIQNAINIHAFERCQPTPHGQPLRLVNVGRLIECKGLNIAIEAVSLLQAQRIDVTLDIVGDGPLRAELERQVKYLQLQDKITFHGSRSHLEIAHLFNNAHVFVMPGIRARDGATEAFGNVVIEAQAAGLPIIGSNIGGIPETFSDSFTGKLVTSNDPAALADAIRSLSLHPEEWRRLQSNTKSYAQLYHARRTNNPTVLSLYKRIHSS